MSEPTQPDARTRPPEVTLRALGVHCTVEARGNLAVLIPAAAERALENAAVRRAVLAALRAHGFTHAALEPSDAPDRPSEIRGRCASSSPSSSSRT